MLMDLNAPPYDAPDNPILFSDEASVYRAFCMYYHGRRFLLKEKTLIKVSDIREKRHKHSRFILYFISEMLKDHLRLKNQEDNFLVRSSRKNMEKFNKDLRRFQEKLDDLTAPTIGLIVRISNNLPDIDDPLGDLENAVSTLEEITRSVANIEDRGGRSASNANRILILRTVRLFKHWSGRFPRKSFSRAKGRRLENGEYPEIFVNPDMQFIYEFTHTVEPSITTASIPSALKTVNSTLCEFKNPNDEIIPFLNTEPFA